MFRIDTNFAKTIKSKAPKALAPTIVIIPVAMSVVNLVPPS